MLLLLSTLKSTSALASLNTTPPSKLDEVVVVIPPVIVNPVSVPNEVIVG